MSERRNYMGSMWMQNEDGVITIGINEEALEDFDEISSVDLSPEGEKVEAEAVIGTIETSDGPLDIYSPVDGEILEVNSQVVEDPDFCLGVPALAGRNQLDYFQAGVAVRPTLDSAYQSTRSKIPRKK